MKVNHGCFDICMAEQVTDTQDVLTHFQQVGGIAVAQGVERAGLKNPRCTHGITKQVTDLLFGYRLAGGIIKQIHTRVICFQVPFQYNLDIGREGDITVLFTFP